MSEAGPSAPAAARHAHRHVEGRLRSADGLSLYDQAWLPAGTPRAGLLVVHGLKDHSSRYAGLAEALVQQGWLVGALDLRGHGRSEGRRVYVDRFSRYLDDVDALVQEVHRGHPELPLFLFGHSMGGAIAALYTIDRKPPLRGLLLSAPALQPTPDVSPGLIRFTRLLNRVAPKAGVFKLQDELFSRDPAVVADLRADPLVHHKGGAARTAAELLGAMGTVQARAAELRLPCLVLHGTADRLTNPAGSARFVGGICSSDKTLKTYPGLYHDLLHEPEKTQVLSDVVGWLSERTGRE